MSARKTTRRKKKKKNKKKKKKTRRRRRRRRRRRKKQRRRRGSTNAASSKQRCSHKWLATAARKLDIARDKGTEQLQISIYQRSQQIVKTTKLFTSTTSGDKCLSCLSIAARNFCELLSVALMPGRHRTIRSSDSMLEYNIVPLRTKCCGKKSGGPNLYAH